MIWLLMSIFFTIFFLIYALLPLLNVRRYKVSKRIESVEQKIPVEQRNTPPIQYTNWMERAVLPMTNRIRKRLKEQISSGKESEIEMKLLQAGQPFDLTPVDFRMIQLMFFLLVPLFAFGFSFAASFSLGQQFVLMLISFIFAIWYPNFYLSRKAKLRRWQALKELPDFLDLLTVSMEAGLGFDAAIGKVVEKQEGVLAEEFRRALDEIRLGRTRVESLLGVRDRLDLDELSQVISAVIQADRLGVGMVNVLRVQSQEMRDQRKQRAEEEAMKAPIKMLFPLVLFVFPSLFIVLLGPALIQFITSFKQ